MFSLQNDVHEYGSALLQFATGAAKNLWILLDKYKVPRAYENPNTALVATLEVVETSRMTKLAGAFYL